MPRCTPQPIVGVTHTRSSRRGARWAHDPGRIAEHGTEAGIIGRYCPQLTYTDKATFEAADA